MKKYSQKPNEQTELLIDIKSLTSTNESFVEQSTVENELNTLKQKLNVAEQANSLSKKENVFLKIFELIAFFDSQVNTQLIQLQETNNQILLHIEKLNKQKIETELNIQTIVMKNLKIIQK